MKTILFKKIDGHEIITGFSDPVINPVETQEKIAPLVKATSEGMVLEDKKREIKIKVDRSRKILKDARNMLSVGKKSEADFILWNQRKQMFGNDLKRHLEQFIPVFIKIYLQPIPT